MKTGNKWTSKYNLVAHAMGGIDKKSYTNSLEAFYFNYNAGHRVFEVDFTISKDGFLVARHDWNNYLNDWSNFNGEPLSLKEFKSLKVCKMYTPLDIFMIGELMDKYKDFYIVTDTKSTDKVVIKQQFQQFVDQIKRINPFLLERIIPQIYNEEMLDVIREIHHFDSVIYTLYQSTSSNNRILDFVAKNDIDAVAMFDVRCSKEFLKNLSLNGVYTYIHTINSLERMTELSEMGVHGFYTDFILPNDFLCHKRNLSSH